MEFLPHKTHSPRDVFLYLLAVGTLYISAWRLIALLFQYVDALLPDELAGLSTYYSYDEMRTSISTLLIVFPVYLATTWYLRKDAIHNPEKRELGVRKGLLNFTLFVAVITIIVDLVQLTNTFLNGDLTLRFFLKVVIVLLIVGAILAYYLWDLRRETTVNSKPSKLLATSVSAVVIISIMAGFFIVGSPATQRKKRFDEKRAANLEFVQGQIINYWQINNKLPSSLDETQAGFTGVFIPENSRDPETLEPFEYRIANLTTNRELSFELCATFDLPSENNTGGKEYYPMPMMTRPPYPMGAYPDEAQMHNWQHGIGRTCFARTINPKLYQASPYSAK